MMCRQKMIEAGEKMIPRSCRKCGLGPCQEKSSLSSNNDPVVKSGQLKQIAGLIQKLSYRDMQDLAAKLWGNLDGDNGGSDNVAMQILQTADDILNDTPAVSPPAVTMR